MIRSTFMMLALTFAVSSGQAQPNSDAPGANNPADVTETNPAPATRPTDKKKSANVPMVNERPDTKVYTYKITGMHCESCVASLQKALCEKEGYESCHVALVDPKAQVGQIRITPRTGQIVDYSKLKSQAKSAGYTLSR